MKALIKVANLNEVKLAITYVGTAKEWRAILDKLATIPSGYEINTFRGYISDLINAANKEIWIHDRENNA